jgi:basic membrane protein A and related proteins
MAFSQSFYEGLKIVQVQQEMGGPDMRWRSPYSENMFNVPDAAAAIRDYAATGYDIVFAHRLAIRYLPGADCSRFS